MTTPETKTQRQQRNAVSSFDRTPRFIVFYDEERGEASVYAEVSEDGTDQLEHIATQAGKGGVPEFVGSLIAKWWS